MNNIFEPRLFHWQFSQVWRINLCVALIASIYVLIRVVPFHKPEILLFAAVVIHSALVVRKLGSASANRSTFLYSMGFTRDQIWWQTLFASLASAALVCGVALLLILVGVRSAVQQHNFGNAYFPVSATKEFWMPVLLMTSYLLAIPLFHYAFIRGRQNWRDPNSGWATVIVGLGLFGWYTLKMSLATCSTGELFLFAACHVPAVITLIFASWKMHGTMELSS